MLFNQSILSGNARNAGAIEIKEELQTLAGAILLLLVVADFSHS